MMKTFGNKQRNEITIPFNGQGSLRFDVANINPETIQRKSAERLASQVMSCNNIGIISKTPATNPSNKQIAIFFSLLPSYLGHICLV